MTDKTADLAGPGIGDYSELETVLPDDYTPLLAPRETMEALFAAKNYIEEGLCRALGLMMVQVPLIVDADSGVNDYLDRDGSRGPVEFHISNDNDLHPIEAQVVQAATKWKRVALAQFAMGRGEGICTDMKAVRKDYFLDHDHSAYVDQWDWEKAIAEEDRTLAYLTETVRRIWAVIKGAERHVQDLFPQLATDRYPDLPEDLTFLHAEDILDMYPICRANNEKRPSSRTTRRSSSTESAGPWQTAIPTSCGRPTTTTGSPKRHRPTAVRCTASTVTFSCGIRSPGVDTSSARWGSG
jgi:aspartate--ammonia ligase